MDKRCSEIRLRECVAHLALHESEDFIKPYVSPVKSGPSVGRYNIYEIWQARARATIRVISARDISLSARVTAVFTDGRALSMPLEEIYRAKCSGTLRRSLINRSRRCLHTFSENVAPTIARLIISPRAIILSRPIDSDSGD